VQHILLVEDDSSIVEMVHNHLSKEGFIVTSAMDGEEGVSKFRSGAYDLIIIDIMMPKMDGLEVIKWIRAKSHIPIIIMSAKDGDIDKALGLGFGADDYLAKPFSLIELSARVKAAIRRATKYMSDAQESELALGSNATSIVTCGTLRIDLNNFAVEKNGEGIKLTSKEFEILKLFVTNPGRVFTKAQLYGFVWNNDYYGDENVINVHIRRLREKIEDQPSEPRYLKTLWGIGYKWEGE